MKGLLLGKIKEALQGAAHAADKMQLKIEIKKRTQAIICTDQELFRKLMKKFPKEKFAHNTKAVGQGVAFTGAVVVVATYGIFGIPMACAGALATIFGSAMGDYKHYTILVNLDEKQVIFVKIKGRNALELSQYYGKLIYNFK